MYGTVNRLFVSVAPLYSYANQRMGPVPVCFNLDNKPSNEISAPNSMDHGFNDSVLWSYRGTDFVFLDDLDSRAPAGIQTERSRKWHISLKTPVARITMQCNADFF